MYYVADIALVTPLRDGMNLVAKEYVATKCDNPGVLILSEMAGATVETDGRYPNQSERYGTNKMRFARHLKCRRGAKAALATYAKYSVCTDSQQMGSRLCQ